MIKIKVPTFYIEVDPNWFWDEILESVVSEEAVKIFRQKAFKDLLRPAIKKAAMDLDFDKVAEKAVIKSMESIFK